MAPPVDVRTTLPSLEQVEDGLHTAVDELVTVVGIPIIVDEDAENALGRAIERVRDATKLVVWVAGVVRSLPHQSLPLDPVKVALAPPQKHTLLPENLQRELETRRKLDALGAKAAPQSNPYGQMLTNPDADEAMRRMKELMSRPANPLATSGELLRRRLEQERADFIRRMQMEEAESLHREIDAALLGTPATTILNGEWALVVKSDEAVPEPEPRLTLLPKGTAEPVDKSVQRAVNKKANAAAKKRAEEEAAALAVFTYWQEVMGKQRSIFDDTRRTRIITRLRENSGDIGELLYAIDGAAKDDWLMGRDERSNGKKYNGIEVVFRDRAQVEKLAESQRGYQQDKEHPVVLAMGGQSDG